MATAVQKSIDLLSRTISLPDTLRCPQPTVDAIVAIRSELAAAHANFVLVQANPEEKPIYADASACQPLLTKGKKAEAVLRQTHRLYKDGPLQCVVPA